MNLPLLTSGCLCGLAIVAAIPAQALHVVPSEWSGTDAPAMLGLSGVGTTEHQQILIDPSKLTPLVGHRITGLVFRRDAGDAVPLATTSGAMVVRIGQAACTWDQANADFAVNLPQSTEVYRGSVVAPNSPAVAGSSVAWSPENIIELTFASSFDYLGGTLCIDLTGTSTQPTWWPIDAAEDGTIGSVVSEGVACGPRAQILGQTAFVAAADLVVGRSMLFKFFGEPGSSAALLIGADTLPNPIDLAIVGAPGCMLLVNPLADVAAQLSSELAATPFGGVANVTIQLPAQTALLSTSFVVQWLEMLPTSFATSNALRCAVASTGGGLGMSVVWQRPGGSSIVDSTRAPVLGLRYQ